ncbi:hypothetical protein GYMLUDRAFT_53938 [Collybiopsis luxurians FD-317 M1]|nr:hypothetical protein GYMLUDRAFT_53938 [Collybiopsis luxurians FD-317 M1]
MSPSVNSTVPTFLALTWCRVYMNLARLASILSTIVITLWPHTRAPMPHRKRAAPIRSVSLSSLASGTTIESSTSTLVEESAAARKITVKKNPILFTVASRKNNMRRAHTTFTSMKDKLTITKSINRSMKPFTRCSLDNPNDEEKHRSAIQQARCCILNVENGSTSLSMQNNQKDHVVVGQRGQGLEELHPPSIIDREDESIGKMSADEEADKLSKPVVRLPIV